MYKIGEVAELFQITVQALRHYEKKGLLIPAAVNAQNGYRYYHPRQFERLRLIIFLRNMGLPIKEIKNQVNYPHGSRYLQYLEYYKKSLELKIAEDTVRINYLNSKIDSIRSASSLPQNRVLFLKWNEQRVIKYDKPITDAVDHEITITEFIKRCKLSPGIGRIGQLFDPGGLSCDGKIVSTSMFVSENLCLEKSPDLDYSVFPEGIYATLYYQKHTDESLPFMYELIAECHRHSFQYIGNIIRSVVYDIGDCEQADSGYLACIRILVKNT